MGEPIYRWVCTRCDASGVGDSSELARLALDMHMTLEHGSADAEADATQSGQRQARRWSALLRRLIGQQER